ncbi:MAG: DUF5056 domain-containing protein [Mangrovibacterium sp.]
MKEDKSIIFLQEHKQHIADNGFSNRILAAVNCLPAPAPRQVPGTGYNWLITVISAFLGFGVFALLGGYAEIIHGLSTLGDAVKGLKALSPENTVSVLILACSLYAVGKFAIEAE